MKIFIFNDFATEFQQSLSTINFNRPETPENELWNNFDKISNSTFNKHAPSRPPSRKEPKRSPSPWIANEILGSFKIEKQIIQEGSN